MADSGRPTDTASRLDPQFVDGPNGALLFSSFLPRALSDCRKAIICLPPFAEEMNKSRRMLALQGRRIADKGTMFLLPDLTGTGDSGGAFEDADLGLWRRDVQFAVEWLRTRGIEDIGFLALRFGSLLLGAALAASGQPAHKAVLWNPALSGAALLKQFFRTRLAADMQGGIKTTVEELRARLASEGQMEIAGYFLSQQLVESMDAAGIEDLDPGSPLELLWVDTSPVAGGDANPKTRTLLTRWADNGVDAAYRRVQGQPFWMSPEIKEVDELLEITADFLTGAD